MRTSSRFAGVFCALGLAAAVVGVAAEASAFKPGTHVAASNNVRAQLNAAITNDSVTNTLVFEVNGRRLNLNINAKQAYRAVIDQLPFFRAGVVGPDGFPDPLTGQMIMHGHSKKVQELVTALSGAPPMEFDHSVPFEQRLGASEYRSIDFASAMLNYLNSGFVATDTERQQALAFILGYISHGVGDGFAHTWVNELAGGAWDLGEGGGIWGQFSEEIKHVAVETLVDSKVPSNLISTAGDGGGRGLIVLRSPDRFLDEFYAAQIANARLTTGDKNGDLPQFFQFYANIDQFHGGLFYSYFNAQVDLAPAIKNWTGLSGVFDTAEGIKKNGIVNFVLNTAALPAEVLQELSVYGPEAWLDDLTGGYINCHAERNSLNDVEKIRLALDFLGGVNDRVKRISHKAMVVRRNWIRLSECTSQNLAKTNAAAFNPDQPTLNTDACADIVRLGWADEGNADGLFRGDIRPGLELDNEFLLDLKAAFLGGDADELYLNVQNPEAGDAPFDHSVTVESANGHRGLSANLDRMKDYLVGVGFSASKLPEGVLPQQEDESSRDRYNEFCGTVRDPGYARCLELKFMPIALVAREGKCLYDHGVCTASNVKTCLSDLCMHACVGSNSQCSQVCGGGKIDGCSAGCDDALCTTIFGVDVCVPILHDLCTDACTIFSDNEDNCIDAAVDELKCGVEHIKCGVDTLTDSFKLNNFANDLLGPAKDACTSIDRAIAFVECLKGDATKTPDEQSAARRVCLIDACAQSPSTTRADCVQLMDDVDAALAEVERVKDAITKVAEVLEDRPPHELVNLAFLQEDMLQDPTYFTNLKNAAKDTRDDLEANPPAPSATPQEVADYNEKINTLDRFDQLVKDVEDIKAGKSPSGNPLVDIRNAATEASSILAKAAELGLIPTVVGPTAQKILSDIGPNFNKTFAPFFNTLQGMKLAPVNPGDLTITFDNEGVDSALLPWRGNGAAYSNVCNGTAVNAYCDVLKSFDDPNCMNCGGANLETSGAPLNWAKGRGLVSWNDYDPTQTKQHVLTNFPLTYTDKAYDELYTRVFQVPTPVPAFAGFDDPKRPWTSSNGTTSINGSSTQGSGSTALNNACGYTRLESPYFMTTEFGVVGSELWFDVFIPSQQANPSWVGDVQVAITIPGANINEDYLPSWVGLTNLPRGAWSTLKYTVPANVQEALLGDYADARISIIVNLGSCGQPTLFDNLRFAGDIKNRERFHIRGSETHPVNTSSVFSFDNRSDWSSQASLSTSSTRVEGNASLAVSAGGWTTVQSRGFDTSLIGGAATSRLSLDVYIPNPQANRWWYGDVQLYMTCGPLNNSYIGQRSLTYLFTGEFNTLEYSLTPQQVSVLNSNYSNCTMTVALSVSSGNGVFRLDNMGFY